MADTLRIKKIKLNDGSVYAIFDEGSLRLNDNNVLITGNDMVDNVIINGSLQITEIDDIPVNKSLEYVLTWDASTGSFYKCTLADLFSDDIYELSVDNNNVLTLNNLYVDTNT